jgi:hypothetical protein
MTILGRTQNWPRRQEIASSLRTHKQMNLKKVFDDMKFSRANLESPQGWRNSQNTFIYIVA